MSKNRIEINGSIDRYSYSANYFRYQLKNCSEGPVILIVNSFGGDVNEALNICNQIAGHGDVTVEYVSFNASAATLLGLYAKHSRINSDSLYLIHKAMVWVDAWGTMNADQIDDAIQELLKQKKTAEVSTLTLAKSFSNKSGRPVTDILGMMKDAKWMTAEEVVSAGFVDEVIESKCKKKPVISNDVAAIFNANGIPIPMEVEAEDTEENGIMATLTDIKETITGIFSKHNKLVTMDKQFQFLNQVAGVEGFEVKDETITISVAQLTAFNDALKKADADKTAQAAVVNSANNDRDTAKNNLQAVLVGLDSLDESVKNASDKDTKLAAVKTLIETRPGVNAAGGEGSDHHSGTAGDLVLDDVNNFFKQ